MAKKYLSLEEAAQLLGIEPDQLVRLRENGEIRGFADRASWKFRLEDVQEFGRTRQADSNPEVPMIEEESSILGEDQLEADDSVGEQPTVIRRNALDEDDESSSPSDSDVRLILDDSLTGESGDSDPGLPMPALSDSDSDVRLADENEPLVDNGSDSDVMLIPDESDSDVRLLDSGDEKSGDSGSDSDVRLVGADPADKGSESEVSLVPDDDGPSIELSADDEDEASVFSDDEPSSSPSDAGATMAAGSGILGDGPMDSGISLESDDSGISLFSEEDDSGISLESADSHVAFTDEDDSITLADDSGISLQSADDSGIALEKADDVDRTVPMLDALDDEDDDATQMEVPAISDDDSEFELAGFDDDDDQTNVLLLDDDEADDHSPTVVKKSAESGFDDEEFDMEADVEEFAEADEFDDFDDDAIEASDDAFDDDDDIDVFDADDDDFDESFETGESQAEFVSPLASSGRMAAPAEAEWGTGIFVGLFLSTALMSLCGMLIFDLVRSMWGWHEPATFNSTLLDTFRDLF